MRKWSCSLQNKKNLRQSLLDQRKTISADERKQAAEQALTLFLASPQFRAAQHIACYFAQDNEFDCTPIIEALWSEHKQVYLPVLLSKQENCLEFVKYGVLDPLRLNKFHILEPDHTEVFPTYKLDLVLMPLVGFDLQGGRLGMGGGFYDRTFEFMNNEVIEKKPILLGLAFEAQKVAELPRDPWDVPLDGVLTEKTIYLF